MSELKLILFYSFLLFFIMAVGNLGATDYLADGYNIEPPTPPPPTTDLWTAMIDTVLYVFENIGFLFTLMTIDPFGVGLISTLLFSPLAVGLFYIIIKLIRGGG
ncbi:MAG: hypothetical protein ACP6IY_18940 [Promethearchaeia archaeon]